MHICTNTTPPPAVPLMNSDRVSEMVSSIIRAAPGVVRAEMRKRYFDYVVAPIKLYPDASAKTPDGALATLSGIRITINDTLPWPTLCRFYNAKGHIVSQIALKE